MSDLVTIAELKAQGLWKTRYISASGLIPYVKNLHGNVRGVEIGACRGENASRFLEECPNIQHLDVIDPYTAYTDVNGTSSQETLDRSKQICQENLLPFGDRATLRNTTSLEFCTTVPDESFQYIFIDGNHSYEHVRNDIFAWYPKLVPGGIFAGHDVHLRDVQQAINEFRSISMITVPVKTCDNSVWFWYK